MTTMLSDDPALPNLREALNPTAAARIFQENGNLHPILRCPLVSATLVRHKPGRRAVIEYAFENHQRNETSLLIGKIRRQRSGRGAFDLLQNFQRNGFDEGSLDNIFVPAPIAHIKPLRLNLQRKVTGTEATQLLAGAHGVDVARRIAEAAYKIHRADIAPRHRHDMIDELRFLHTRLDQVAQQQLAWCLRLDRLKRSASRIGMALTPSRTCGIHRDFYADQIIVDGERLWLLDFDLYCAGDPGLDIGNFVGHITEQSLRLYGGPAALLEVENTLIEHYAELAGDEARPAIRVYTLLTLMRHIYLSTQHEERQPYTEALLTLCERRAAAELKNRVMG
ncbi:MAG: phosphotransferase [Pseudomonadota bacterium]